MKLKLTGNTCRPLRIQTRFQCQPRKLLLSMEMIEQKSTGHPYLISGTNRKAGLVSGGILSFHLYAKHTKVVVLVRSQIDPLF